MPRVGGAGLPWGQAEYPGRQKNSTEGFSHSQCVPLLTGLPCSLPYSVLPVPPRQLLQGETTASSAGEVEGSRGLACANTPTQICFQK